MTNSALAFLLVILTGAFVVLLAMNVVRKLHRSLREKRNLKITDQVRQKLDGLLAGTDSEFDEGLKKFVSEVTAKDRNYIAVLDEYLLNVLKIPDTEHRERLLKIADHLNFPSECLAQVKSRNHRISALGYYRAGIYSITEAAEDMELALDLDSSENQFGILMGLARMGGAEALIRAFEKIKENVLVNDRGIIEILSAFPDGEEKEKLFRTMIKSDTEYFTILFLKALGKDMAKLLMDDINLVFKNGNKEVRAAAIHGLSTLGEKVPAKILIKALEDKDWEIRALAAKALKPVKTSEASSALYNVLFDQQWWVRQNAANSLTEHPGYEALFIKASESGDEYARDSIISALENGGSPVLLRSIKLKTV